MTDCIRISPPKSPRTDWEEATKEMAAAEEDEYLWGELPLAIDGEEWKW